MVVQSVRQRERALFMSVMLESPGMAGIGVVLVVLVVLVLFGRMGGGVVEREVPGERGREGEKSVIWVCVWT